jgi:hypothetical protein
MSDTIEDDSEALDDLEVLEASEALEASKPAKLWNYRTEKGKPSPRSSDFYVIISSFI